MTDDKALEPVTQKKGLHKSKLERTAFESWVAKMILSGHSVSDLVVLYEDKFNKTTTYNTVTKAITKLRKQWLISQQEDTNLYMNMELERLDLMEAQAWGHYRRVGGTVQDTEVKDLFFHNEDGKERKAQSVTTVRTREVPALAMHWFDRILKIQESRRKVLRMEAVVNVNNIMAVKGYAFFDPGKDWEQQHPNVPDGNVVDAEFEESRNSNGS